MELIKSSQETDSRIFNNVRIGEFDWRRLNMYGDYIWSINQKTNTNS